MFEKATHLSLFPTFVWIYDLKPEDYEDMNKILLKKIKEIFPPNPDMSSHHSLQSVTNLHEVPEFSALMSFALNAANETLDFLEHESSEMIITGCWANISTPGSYHHEHSHPNNFLSGVYYVNAPRGGNTINFHDPRPQAHSIAPRVRKMSPKHASILDVGLKSGRMVLFPSWLRHSVDNNRSNETRVSISFNIMFEYFKEKLSRPRFKGLSS